MTETLKPRAANVGPVQRRYGKPQMMAEKIAMAAQRSVLFPSRWRPALLRLFGAEVGRNIRIAQQVFLGQPSNLTIEDGGSSMLARSSTARRRSASAREAGSGIKS